MNRSLTAAFAAFEALLVVAIGIGIPLAPLTVLWALQYGFAPDWAGFWRSSADTWLVGHGVDLTLALDPKAVAGLKLDGAGEPFVLSIAALGFAMLTALLGRRAGRRIAQTDHRLLGALVALAFFALLSTGITLSAQLPLASPSISQGILLPTLVFGLGLGVGSLLTKRSATDATGSSIRDWIGDWRPATRALFDTALRGGALAVAAIVAVAAIIAAMLILSNYAQIITLYEGLHADVLGGLALTIAQIAFLPNLVLWAVSWLIGPGFAIGLGSAVSPLGTSLGPIPAIPVLGALPVGDASYAFVGLLVPVLAGFLAGAVLHARLVANSSEAGRWPRLLAAGLGAGLVGGTLLGLLSWAAAGSAGPGRLVQVGADPMQVGIWAAVEIGAACVAGLFAASRMPRGILPR